MSTASRGAKKPSTNSSARVQSSTAWPSPSLRQSCWRPWLNRSELELNSQRDRNPNFVILSDGSVRNGYNLKVVNKANESRTLTLSIEGDAQIETRLLGAADDAPMQLRVDADRTQDFVIYLTLPASAIDGPRETFNFRVTDTRTGETATTPSMIVTGAE